MHIEQEIKLDFKDVLIRPKRSTLSTRSSVDLTRTFCTLNSKQDITITPIIASNMDVVGTFAMAKVLSEDKLLTCFHKYYPKEDLLNFFIQNYDLWKYVFYTMGITNDDMSKLEWISNQLLLNGSCNDFSIFPALLCLDVANGYTKNFHDIVSSLREKYPKSIIMAGNVATPEMVEQLLERGADIVKIGIGPGSVCTTRVKTGVGYPQLSAIIECADAAHGYGGLICSDGGCTIPGDVCKAFGAGSDFVMLGGMFSGTDECEGEWILNEDGTKSHIKFYGMSSREAMEKYNGKVASYRTSEGKCVKVKYKGPVKDVVQDILGGLRSACTYVGASKLKHFSKCCTFIRVTQQENKIFNEE